MKKEEEILDLARNLFRNQHPLFGFEHGYRTMKNVEKLIRVFKIEGIDLEVAMVGGLFHDIAFDDFKDLPTHGKDSASRYTDALNQSKLFNPEQIKRISLVTIRHSRFTWSEYGEPESVEEKIVFDADQFDWLSPKGVLKYYELCKGYNKTFDEFYQTLPQYMISRYRKMFFEESRQYVKKDFLQLMKFLKADPNNYQENKDFFKFN